VNRETFPDLDAERQIELAALKRALRMVDGFALYVARTNTAVLRRQIIADLHASLPRPLVQLTLSLDEPPYEQMARVAEGAPADAVLSVEGMDVLAPSDDPDWLLKELNWRRAAYRRLARPLLLWAPEYLLRLLMQHPGDHLAPPTDHGPPGLRQVHRTQVPARAARRGRLFHRIPGCRGDARPGRR